MPRIVVVDDDPSNSSLIKLLLEMDGYSVVTSPDIASAKVMADGDTDAFLIDYHLARGANGLDLLRDIRQGNTPASADSVVIVTSGDYRRESEAREAGANKFMLKPYPADALSQELSRLLAARKNNA